MPSFLLCYSQSGLYVEGWDGDVPACLDGAAQGEFTERRRSRKTNPKPQKVGTKEQSKERALAGQPLQGWHTDPLPKHPVQSEDPPSQDLARASEPQLQL